MASTMFVLQCHGNFFRASCHGNFFPTNIFVSSQMNRTDSFHRWLEENKAENTGLWKNVLFAIKEECFRNSIESPPSSVFCCCCWKPSFHTFFYFAFPRYFVPRITFRQKQKVFFLTRDFSSAGLKEMIGWRNESLWQLKNRPSYIVIGSCRKISFKFSSLSTNKLM
jgi:hypothetical protein